MPVTLSQNHGRLSYALVESLAVCQKPWNNKKNTYCQFCEHEHNSNPLKSHDSNIVKQMSNDNTPEQSPVNNALTVTQLWKSFKINTMEAQLL